MINADHSSTQRCTMCLKFSGFQHPGKTDHPSGPIDVTSCHNTMGYSFTRTNQDIKIIQNLRCPVVLFYTVSRFLCCEIHLSCCNASVRRHEEAGPTETRCTQMQSVCDGTGTNMCQHIRVHMIYTRPTTSYGVARIKTT